MEKQLIEELEGTLRNEEVRCTPAAPPINPVGRKVQAEEAIGAGMDRFEGLFGENARHLLQEGYSLASWSPSKVDASEEKAFMGVGEGFRLSLGPGRGVLIRINRAKEVGLWLHEEGWAPLDFYEERGAILRAPKETHPTTAENLKVLVDGLKALSREAEIRRALYEGCITFLSGEAKGLLVREFGPRIMQEAYVPSFTELSSALGCFAPGAVEGGRLKDPERDAFLRDLIQQPHALLAVKQGEVGQGYETPWLLARVTDDGHLKEILDSGSNLVATTLPTPGGLGGPTAVVRLPMGPLAFSLDLKGLGPRGILIQLGAALKGRLLVV